MPLWLPPPAPLSQVIYASTSAAVTTGLNPVISHNNPTTPWWSPAGSGGGGSNVGPDLTVSTLTVAPGTPGIKLMNAAGNVTANITGYRAANSNTNDTTFSVAYPSGYLGPEGLSGVLTVENIGGSGNYYGDLATGRLAVLGQNGGTTNPVPIIDAGTNSDLVIAANTSINLSTPTILQNGVPLAGGAVPANATFSTITVADGNPNAPNILSDGQIVLRPAAGDAVLFTDASSQAYIQLTPTDPPKMLLVNSNSQVCVSIAGNSSGAGLITAGPGGTGLSLDNISTMSVSTITGDVTVGGNLTVGSVIANPNLIVANPATAVAQDIIFYTNNTSIHGSAANIISVNSPSGTYNIQMYSEEASPSAGNGGIQSGTQLNLASPAGIACWSNVSVANSPDGTFTSAVVNASTITINSNVVLPFAPTLINNSPNYIQGGYVQDHPYGTPYLFPVPYANDKVQVMLTPTNRGTTGGANPNCSLGNDYGNDGNGVSSIGFGVDTRNGGVGYNGSFFWMAFPLPS